jgi:hypothetical protein
MTRNPAKSFENPLVTNSPLLKARRKSLPRPFVLGLPRRVISDHGPPITRSLGANPLEMQRVRDLRVGTCRGHRVSGRLGSSELVGGQCEGPSGLEQARLSLRARNSLGEFPGVEF